MSIARHHAEWLSLVEVSGPFLSMPVLMRVFPQGLEAHDSERFRTLRAAYDEWEEEQNKGRKGKFNPAIHVAWIKFILNEILELPEQVILEGQAVPQSLCATIAQQGETLRPDLVIKNLDGGPNASKPRLLIQTYPYTQDLEKPIFGKTWKASPATRMMELLHATGIRLGLVTNGERWMLVDAPKDETTGFASWYAHLWLEEPITYRAFRTLLSVERFFNVSDSDTLEAMLAESASNQQEVTDQLGYQVRKAVEVLIQSLDRADQDHGRALLGDVSEPELYEAALTVMMRLVFLFCAEERGLLLLDDELYAECYAVSTVREQLRETADQHGEEILERRHDAWCRLLSTFRVVYSGVEHDRMTLPAYGGRLFDPDRFPFLEGRKKGTTWRQDRSEPLPVNNRTVLHLLEALQILQVRVPGGGPAEARRLSFRALDIEQIGHVYEGLLDHTAKRASEPTLGLAGTRDREPEIALSKLEEMQGKGQDALIEFLNEETGRSASALKKALNNELDLSQSQKLEAACGTDKELWKRIQPFAGLVRNDTFGYPVIVRSGSVYVTSGTDRRSSGTHYTPRSLTEPIVQYTLEPLVYIGPAEGKPKEQWKRRSPGELLDLKICDMACGSGAFLVQACRYMAERLLESWELEEKAHPGVPGITPEGKPSTGNAGESLIPKDMDERLIYAQRVVAQRCLYGVDINPLAAEMAKLSLWLLTLAKDKPFTFLDHAIRCGDSLLGIHDLNQLKTFSLDGSGEGNNLILLFLSDRVQQATEFRRQIESMRANTVEDVTAQEYLLRESESKIERLRYAADYLVGAEVIPLRLLNLDEDEEDEEEEQEHAPAWLKAKKSKTRARQLARDKAAIQLTIHFNHSDVANLREHASEWTQGRRTFHWPLEFPEIFDSGGFDAFIGNPPFMGGQKITGNLGTDYRDYLVEHLASGRRGSADLCAYFFLQAALLLRQHGHFGLLATNTIAQGDTREVGLEQLIEQGCNLIRAVPSQRWPGIASLEVAHVWSRKGEWNGEHFLGAVTTEAITPLLGSRNELSGVPFRLKANATQGFQGSTVLGMGFVLTEEATKELLRRNPVNSKVILPYLNGEDVNSQPNQVPRRWVINFWNWPLNRNGQGNWLIASDEERSAWRRQGIVPKNYPDLVAADFPDCLAIIEEKVKPERAKNNDKRRREIWWQFTRPTLDLYEAIGVNSTAIVAARVTKYLVHVAVSSDYVFDVTTNVVLYSPARLCVLNTSIYDAWVREYSSSLKDFVRYTVTDAFETYSFPPLTAVMTQHGEELRRTHTFIMNELQEGLTKLYNRYHKPDTAAENIQKLRELHVEMDRAVAAAYGWDDLDLGHGFHETKQGIRFTISENARREVLTRLLKLNHERYAEEVAQGLHEKKGKGKSAEGRTKKGKSKSRPKNDSGQMTLGDIAADG